MGPHQCAAGSDAATADEATQAERSRFPGGTVEQNYKVAALESGLDEVAVAPEPAHPTVDFFVLIVEPCQDSLQILAGSLPHNVIGVLALNQGVDPLVQ